MAARRRLRLDLLHDAHELDRLRGGDREAGDSGESSSRGARLTVLVGVALMLAASALDATIISVALPTIRNDLGGGPEVIQWVASVYFLAAAVLLVPAGRMVDLVGARRVLVAGGAVYVTGSVLGAVATEPLVLILGRAVQGAGSGIMSPAAVVLVATVYGPRRRGTAIGLVTGMLALASTVGPVLGGILTDTVGWQVIFVNHAVLAGLGTALILRAPSRPGAGGRVSLDGRGTVAWAGTILAFQLAVLHWGALGGLAGPMLLGVSVLVGWVLVRTERRQDDPLFDLSLLKIPAVAAAAVARSLVAFAFFGNIFYLTLFLQSDAGYSAAQTGLILLPASLAGVAASPLVGKAVDRFGSGVVLELGTAAAALGLFVLAVVHETSSVVAHIAPGLVLNGLGFAMVSVSAKSAPLEAVAADLHGRVTSLVSVISKAAAGLGVTVATGLFNLYSGRGIDNGISDYELDGSDALRSFVRDRLGSSELRESLTPSEVVEVGFASVAQAADVIEDSFAFSMSLMMGSVALLVLGGAGAVALLLRRSR
jgi:DHA2 family methylenomycin A resistance protein-like MFS transporter